MTNLSVINNITNDTTENRERIITQGVLKAAEYMDINAANLAKIIGLSASTLSRMKNGKYNLDINSKEYELGIIFLRIFRSLSAIVSANQNTARHWLINYNTALKEIPLEHMKSIRGINAVIEYLDARRAPL